MSEEKLILDPKNQDSFQANYEYVAELDKTLKNLTILNNYSKKLRSDNLEMSMNCACAHGYLDSMKYYSLNDIKVELESLLRAIELGFTDIVKFGLNLPEIKENIDTAYLEACKYNQKDIINYIKENYPNDISHLQV